MQFDAANELLELEAFAKLQTELVHSSGDMEWHMIFIALRIGRFEDAVKV